MKTDCSFYTELCEVGSDIYALNYIVRRLWMLKWFQTYNHCIFHIQLLFLLLMQYAFFQQNSIALINKCRPISIDIRTIQVKWITLINSLKHNVLLENLLTAHACECFLANMLCFSPLKNPDLKSVGKFCETFLDYLQGNMFHTSVQARKHINSGKLLDWQNVHLDINSSMAKKNVKKNHYRNKNSCW